MNNSSTGDTNRWFKRILDIRREYFFERLRKLSSWSDFSLIETLGWIKDDVVYSAKWGMNIILQIRTYGPVIRREYDCSYTKQFYRMMYLTFIKRVNPKYFRSYLLFWDERWEKVDRFAFDQYEVQYELVSKSYLEENQILRSKLNFFRYWKNQSIHTPEVIGAFENGSMIYPEKKNLQIPNEDIFVKDIFGKSGQGVKKFYFKKDSYSDNTGKLYSKEEIFNFLIDYSRKVRGTVVQKVERNHASWLPYTSGSLATCRIVTARMPSSNSIQPLFCVLRMPIGNLDADNFALGGIASAIDLETGVLNRALAVKPVNGQFQFDYHPDTNQQITGSRLPHFHEVINYAIDVHSRFRIMFLGWDIALTEKGVCVIEGNIGWGADIVESTLNTPLIDTDYPEMFEKWMRIFSE